MTQRIVAFGAGPMFKGGLANYNTSLAKAIDRNKDAEVHIVSWTQQYPAIIPRDFIDRKSKIDLLEGTGIRVHYITNYNNPISWIKTVKLITSINPAKVIIQWSIAIQGLPVGYMVRLLKKRRPDIEVIFDLHFVVQKENSVIDKRLTKYALSKADSFVVHSFKTGKELETLLPDKKYVYVQNHRKSGIGPKQIIKLYHPVYDMFKPDPDFDIAKQKQELGLNRFVFLFFGFIRKYKGLHHAIRAFAELASHRNDVSLLIVGESFWQTLDSKKLTTRIKQFFFRIAKSLVLKKKDDENNYRPLDLIDELGIRNKVVVVNDFVPNEDVHKYFQVSDAILLFYLYATPSGVESIAYNFQVPLLASRVGHFPETVKDGFNGYLAEDGDISSMAKSMEKIITIPIKKENIAESSKEMSWDNYASAILSDEH